jgi:hypothetical protein
LTTGSFLLRTPDRRPLGRSLRVPPPHPALRPGDRRRRRLHHPPQPPPPAGLGRGDCAVQQVSMARGMRRAEGTKCSGFRSRMGRRERAGDDGCRFFQHAVVHSRCVTGTDPAGSYGRYDFRLGTTVPCRVNRSLRPSSCPRNVSSRRASFSTESCFSAASATPRAGARPTVWQLDRQTCDLLFPAPRPASLLGRQGPFRPRSYPDSCPMLIPRIGHPAAGSRESCGARPHTHRPCSPRSVLLGSVGPWQQRFRCCGEGTPTLYPVRTQGLENSHNRSFLEVRITAGAEAEGSISERPMQVGYGPASFHRDNTRSEKDRCQNDLSR